MEKLKPASVTLEGQKILLDPRDSLALSIHNSYDPMATELFKKIIKAGDVIIDIGANIGYFTLLAAKLSGPTGKVLAFEPDSEIFQILQKNIRLNHHKNVTLVAQALSNWTGYTQLYISETNRGDNRIYQHDGAQRTIRIKVTTLDRYLEKMKTQINLSKISLIKIDIQGAELKALKGMKNLLQLNNNLKIITEIESLKLQSFGDSAEKYIDFLAKQHFKFSFINEEKSRIEEADKTMLIKLIKKTEKKKINAFFNLLCYR